MVTDMKKFQTVLIHFMFLGVLLLCALGGLPDLAQAKSRVHLSRKEMSVTVGKPRTMKLYAAKKVKWKANSKLLSVKKITGNKVSIRGKKAGKTILKAKYKGKTYSCKITIKAAKKEKSTVTQNVSADNKTDTSSAQTNTADDVTQPEKENQAVICLNQDSIDLYAMSDTYSQQYDMRQGHSSRYTFLVNGTSKQIKWSIRSATSQSISSYLSIDDDGTVTALKPPGVYCEVKAIVTAKIGQQELQATVTLHDEVDYCIEDKFEDFRNTYLNDDMTEYEKMDKVAWYLSSFFEYDADCYSWVPYLLLGRGDCLASRTTVMWMCRYFGIKACACNNLNYHGETLVQAEGKLYIVTTGYDEPLPRTYNIREVTTKASFDTICAANNIDASYFDAVLE
jgi:hypothetical protein